MSEKELDKYSLPPEQEEEYKSDGFGKTKAPDCDGLIKMWIHVRRDSQIPEFDAITEIRFQLEGLEKYKDFNETVLGIILESGDMFVEDALKLTERDITLETDQRLHGGPKTSPFERPNFIPALRALKKAVCDYFEKTEQLNRLKKATEEVLCTCRYVTNHEILDHIKAGKTTFEEIKSCTGAGTGCNSCIPRVQTFIKNNL